MTGRVNFSQQLQENPTERCSQLIQDIEEQFGITLTVRDDLGTLRLPSGAALLKKRAYHFHPYCELERYQHPEFDRQCYAYCGAGMRKRCRVDNTPLVGLCWKGMREVIVPIWRNGQHFLTIFAAGFRDSDGRNAPNKKYYSADILEAYQKIPLYDDYAARRLTRVLYTLGQGLLQEVEIARQNMDDSSGRKQQIQLFIHYHAHKDCSLEKLAKHLFLSASRTSKVVKALFNQSFQDLIIHERIERAKHLLCTTDHNQETIAEQCGFKNHFYFNRLFSKIVQSTPGAYRKQFTQ